MRKVCLDTNIVIWGLLAEGRAEDEIKRYKSVYLFELLQEEKANVVIPSLVLAEVTARMREENKRPFLDLLQKRIEIIPFCSGAALEYGSIRAAGASKISKVFSRKEITVDSMIIATCKYHGVNTLYTDDEKMRSIAAGFIQAEDLPHVPPQPLPLIQE